jgi:hypothetical protein
MDRLVSECYESEDRKVAVCLRKSLGSNLQIATWLSLRKRLVSAVYPASLNVSSLSSLWQLSDRSCRKHRREYLSGFALLITCSAAFVNHLAFRKDVKLVGRTRFPQ